ncbi:MAG TPA: hypothetical protein VET23_00385, partial [Chitinophagaceae bacterium]|nr:hypothetical protein [Chitinophagaceae bacterium]
VSQINEAVFFYDKNIKRLLFGEYKHTMVSAKLSLLVSCPNAIYRNYCQQLNVLFYNLIYFTLLKCENRRVK